MRGQMPAPPAPYIQEANKRMRARAESRGETFESMIGRAPAQKAQGGNIDNLADVLAAALTKATAKIAETKIEEKVEVRTERNLTKKSRLMSRKTFRDKTRKKRQRGSSKWLV